ncbi:MAG: HPr family phosphocarrier protein [Enterocloster asparagiformis]|nr:HPr family phosphocarrier protein [Enterocloster asparagiformis]
MIKSAFLASDNQTLYRRQMSLLIQTGYKYNCRVTVDLAGRRFNAKSMMHIGDIKAGDRFELIFDGEDETKALEEYSRILKTGVVPDIRPEDEDGREEIRDGIALKCAR